MKRTITILTLLLLISFSHRLFACSCVGERTVKEELKHADAVIVGTVISKQLVKLTDSTMIKMGPNDTNLQMSRMNNISIARYDLLVHDIYKGKVKSDTLTIYTGLGGGDCGIRFEIGAKYIIYGENETYFGQVNNHFIFPEGQNIF